MNGPNPNTLHPMPQASQVTFLKPLAEGRKNVEIGDFTYYDDDENPEAFFDQNVRYHFEFTGDQLIIGPFCAIAKGATFIMNGANHVLDGFSSYPFEIFGHGWEDGFDFSTYAKGVRGDTEIGADVWIGTNATILPGVRIGPGAIIGANAVVSKDVAPYTIVVGNPAKTVKTRFAPTVIDDLLEIAWWEWPVSKITQALPAIRAADIAALKAVT